MGSFVHVADLSDIPPGTAKVVAVQNVEVALFNLEGAIYAIDNICQHAGGPLGEGKIKGDVVICPWHGYRYHIKTGQYVKNPDMSVACYQVKVEDGKISVSVAP
ncbi:MAG: non-heme iron oxygenase ferredoxin subunit [Nitrospirae bacterium]|nr:MAG: non-heme iron oxygenase ferredoxin subunit [Nitrospirota bacterium]